MSDHTPGPWEAVLDTSVNHGSIKSPLHESLIAMVDCRYGKIGEPEANARLIAAAPDLLEALEWVQLECRYAHGNTIQLSGDNWKRFLKKINAAIAAATPKGDTDAD